MAKRQMDIDEIVDKKTGEIQTTEKLNKVIINERRRKDGSLEYSLDFKNCPTMAEQHTAHLTDLNYLIEKFRPDELASYMAAKAAKRPEITGQDFSTVPEGTESKNLIYKLKAAFESLDDDVRKQFSNHIEFIKFIDNPANAEKMVRLGLMTKKQVEENTTTNLKQNQNTPPSQNTQKTDPAPQGAK